MVLYNLSTILASIKSSFGANIFLEEASLGEYKATQVMWRAILFAAAKAFVGHPSSITGRRDSALILQGGLVSQLTRQFVS
jgi:hypothetical protein